MSKVVRRRKYFCLSAFVLFYGCSYRVNKFFTNRSIIKLDHNCITHPNRSFLENDLIRHVFFAIACATTEQRLFVFFLLGHLRWKNEITNFTTSE